MCKSCILLVAVGGGEVTGGGPPGNNKGKYTIRERLWIIMYQSLETPAPWDLR